ncbi:hypothetical protein HNQ80_002452 [Anaerosolibacter carboniphilus]|uniref:Uncharacterized protein n=1 Tax=Anaerosolibacter carboniphilus TaxID=1417629 RepID=A0A841KZK6_9FIRM|nr:hypothetical protein [Anaerosolibacter carboniphilus]
MLKGDENIFSTYSLPLLLKVLTVQKGNIHFNGEKLSVEFLHFINIERKCKHSKFSAKLPVILSTSEGSCEFEHFTLRFFAVLRITMEHIFS